MHTVLYLSFLIQLRHDVPWCGRTVIYAVMPHLERVEGHPFSFQRFLRTLLPSHK